MIGGRVRGRTRKERKLVGENEDGMGTCLVGDGEYLGCRWPACGCAGVGGVVLGEWMRMSGRGSGRGKTNQGVETGNASYGWRCSCERGLHDLRTSCGGRKETCGRRCVRRSLGVELAALGIMNLESHEENVRNERWWTVMMTVMLHDDDDDDDENNKNRKIVYYCIT